MIDMELTPGILPANAGKLVHLSSLGVRYISRSEQAGGRVAIVEYQLPPHSLGAPVHTHTREDEISVVTEGVVGVQVGDDVQSAGVGATIFKPRGIPHTFWNPTDAPARVLEILTPGGFEGYFEEMAALFAEAQGGMPDPQRAGAVMAKYGLRMDFSSIPVLAQRHGLRL